MEWLLSWLQGFLIFRIFMAAVLSLIPDKTYEPYLRFAAGLILLLLIFHPFYEISGRTGELEEILRHLTEGGYQGW